MYGLQFFGDCQNAAFKVYAAPAQTDDLPSAKAEPGGKINDRFKRCSLYAFKKLLHFLCGVERGDRRIIWN